MKKEEEKVLMVAQEIHFAKALAANDKQLRERALRRLNKWLCLKSKSSLEFTEEGFMRIWKGLFYCVWMSDKPLLQESTVEAISQLLHCFVKFRDSLMFMRCFYQAMSQAWFGLDQHRLDKYMMLVRRFVRQSFAVLKKSDWNAEDMTDLSEMLFRALTVAPVGFIMHLADVYLVELSKIGEGKLDSHVVVELVKPWARLLAEHTDMRIISAIKRHVFLYLIRQTDLAMKHSAKFQAWKSQGFPGGDIDLMEEVDSASDISTDEMDDEDADEDEELFLDPRAGRADTVLPPVDFQPSDIVHLLSTTKMNQQRTLAARQSKSISSLIDKFKQLEQEKYPLGLHRINNSYLSDDSTEDEIDKAVERLASFHQEIYEDSGSKKRKAPFNDLGSSVWDVTESKKEPKGIDLILSPHSLASSPWTVNEINENGDTEGGTNVKCKKRRVSGSFSNGMQTPCSTFPSNTSWQKQKLQQNLYGKNTQVINEMIKKASQKKSKNGDIVLNVSASRQTTPSTKLIGKSSGNSKKLKTPGSEKKVLFALSKNKAQDADEYVKTVEKSPMIPYDASKKPLQGVLKQGSLASPINPFYMKKFNQFKRKKSF